MSYISINLYNDVLGFAIKEGIDLQELDKLSSPPSAIQNAIAVPSDHFFELHEVANSALQTGFSLRVGISTKIEDYGALGLSWKTCAWAGEVFTRFERYFKILSDTYIFDVKRTEHYSKIILNREPYRRGVKLSNEASLAGIVAVIQKITEKEIIPVGVTFKHASVHPENLYKSTFGCDVSFSSNENALIYKTQDLNTRTAKADRAINEYLLERVREETDGIKVNVNKVVNDVEILLKEFLPSGIPGISQISEYLGMSNRTLTRRLSEAGITFRDLIKKTQEDLAKELLENSNKNIAEIAYQTGFSEQSAFNRAFKRWTGMSPLEYRKSL